MRRTTLLSALILTISLFTTLQAQPDTLWTKLLGFTGNEYFTSVEQTDDGGFILGGHTSSFFNDSTAYWLARLNSEGDTVWNKLFRAGEKYDNENVLQTSEGGFAIAGDGDPWLIKTDADGNKQWQQASSVLGANVKIHWCEATSDQGFIATGDIESESIRRALVVKTDNSGAVVWVKTFGGEHDAAGLAVTETGSGQFAMAGAKSHPTGGGVTHGWLLMLSASGDSLWSVVYGDTADGYLKGIQETADGGFILVGKLNPAPNDTSSSSDMYLVKTDASGVTEWTQTFGGADEDEGMTVIQTIDLGYTLIGFGAVKTGGRPGAWLIHTDANGDTLWTLLPGDPNYCFGLDLVELREGEYLTAGGWIDWDTEEAYGWIARLGTPTGLTPFEQDSLALVALHDSTDGERWTNKWDFETPVSTWHGVYLANGRVDVLDLHNNGLTGSIPASIADLTELTSLKLGSNQIVEPLPAELGNLSKLTILGLQNCGLTELPTELGNLSALDILYLYDNDLTGTFPSWITNIAGLWALDIRNNQLTGPIPTEITNLTHLQYLNIENNRFDFGDIESFLAAGSPLVDFTYSPQANIGSEASITVYETQPILLTVSTGGVDNVYQWKKDGIAIPSADNDTLLIESASLEDSGVYTLEVTHPTATDLILTSQPINVLVLFGTFESDSLALVDLYNSTGGLANWGVKWTLTDPITTWWGVTISNGRVTGLNIYNNGLTGALPTAIGDLTALTTMYLWNNALTSIPAEIGNLVNLTVLGLSNNQFTEVPAQIGNLTNLETLYIGRNELTSIPAEMGSLSNLTILGLDRNQLTAIPAGIAGLTNLEDLAIFENQIEELPTAIGSLDSLVSLEAYSNRLSSIPAEIGNLVNLTTLGLGQNQLTSLPSEIGNLINLTGLDLNDNQLSSVPAPLGNLANLTHLNLASNRLTTLPAFLGSLTSLEQLNLGGNELTSLPTELSSLVSLTMLELNYNLLSSIPSFIFDLASLEFLFLGYNQITGEIPAGIGNLANLRSLWLNSNQLTGQIPDAIGQLTNLTSLVMFNNELSGSIPDTIGALVNLQSLQLTNNQLTGSIPVAIGNDTSLYSLNLGGNELSGAVPEEITNLYKLSDLRLYENQLEDLPDLSSMTTLSYVLLRENRFTFEDLEPNMTLSGVEYIPQDSVGEKQQHVVPAGQSITMEVPMGGSATQYQWMKNGVDIAGATNATYTISSVQHEDGGIYELRATNTIVTGLQLNSRPIFLLGPNNPPTAGPDSAISIPSGHSFSFSLPGTGATDPDGDDLIFLEVLTTRHGSHRMVDDTFFVYQSMAGYSGPDTVEYIITDGLLGTATGRVLVTLTGDISDPPFGLSRTYGGGGNDRGRAVQQTATGLIIAGSTESYGAGDADAWLIKTAYNGDISWTKTFGGSGHDLSYAVEQTADGGYILAGETSSSGAGDADAWLIKTDAAGVATWTKTYGGSGYDNAFAVQQTTDNGYILAGQTESFGAGGLDAYLIKTDVNGDTVWTKTFGGSEFETFTAVEQTTDGGYILTGQTASSGAGETDIWLVKTNASGATTWTEVFGGSNADIGYAVQQTSDGGYILAGETGSPMYFAADAWLIKTDASGQATWTQTYDYYGGNNGFHTVLEVPDGGYVVGGYTNFGWRANDFWVIGIDDVGNIIWQRPQPMGGYGDDQAFAISLTYNNSVLVLGTTGSFGSGGDDMWVLRIEEPSIQGVEAQAKLIPEQFALHQNYPNPFNPSTTIRFDMPEAADVTLVIYDMLGREVVRLMRGRVEAGYQQIVWNGRTDSGREVPSGIYIARMITAKYHKSMKMVLLK